MNGSSEEGKSVHGKDSRDCHGADQEGRDGEGGNRAHAEKIVDTVRGSVEADKRDKVTPLQSLNYSRAKSDRPKEMKVKMNEKKMHNMTYDYLDAITSSFNTANVNMKNNEGPSYASNKKVTEIEVSHQSDDAEVIKPGEGGVSQKNSEVFWEEYLL